MDTQTAEEYLRHQGALRALARSLVGDEASADDVVQDTWVAALRRPPSDRRNLGGWLAAAARNAARQVGRAEDRRRRRELMAALPERLPSVEEVAERATVHRELVDLVLALDEPYRSTLLLRHFEDLPPRVIAEQLGEKVATIDARLLRGRQRLREELDRRYGRRSDWHGTFVLALGGPEALLPPAPPLGWLHSAAAKTAVAGLLVGGALLGGRALWKGSTEPGEELAPASAQVSESTSSGRELAAEEAERAPAIEGDVDPSETRGLRGMGLPLRDEPAEPSTEELSGVALAPGEGPPGLKRIKGGRVKVGAKVKDVEALILTNEAMANTLVSETPMHTVRVDDFWLMVTEVTNEQYAAYVTATNARPPYTWGGAVIEEGRKAYFEEENERKLAAQASGVRFIRGPRFEEDRWWAKNWEGKGWDVPREILDHPVTFVSYEDAQGYARWAGLRLMTELEYQCAARGETENDWPWGDAWNPLAAACLESGRDGTWPVGSFPEGEVGGIFDLSGNVWEWTSSPFVAFPGYKPLVLTTGRGSQRRKFDALAVWDANARVAVGGSYNMGELALRVTARRNTIRSQSTAALGFRCAASIKPGRDLAEVVWTDKIPGDKLPEDTDYLHEQPTILHRWTAEELAARQGDLTEPGAGPKESVRPPDYAVITGYDALLFVPAEKVDAVSVKSLKQLSRERPQHLGILYTTRPVMEPELRPGAYMIAYRAGGPLATEVDAEAPVWHATPGFAPEEDAYLFFDAAGEPVAALEAEPLLYDRITSAGRVSWEAWVPPERPELRPGEAPPPPPVPKDLVRFSVAVQGRQNNKGFKVVLPLGLKPGLVDETWSSQ